MSTQHYDDSQTQVVPIDTIKPYWRNPRRVTDEAVNMVATSLQSYGYQQPIVVDTDYTIIVGHTRYAAMRRLGVTEVPVQVADNLSPEAVKQYRLIDNKAGEFSFWDHDKMADEIAQMDSVVAGAFFPEMSADVLDDLADSGQRRSEQALIDEWEKVDPRVGFVCPSCFHPFDVEVTREQIMVGRIEQKGSSA